MAKLSMLGDIIEVIGKYNIHEMYDPPEKVWIENEGLA